MILSLSLSPPVAGSRSCGVTGGGQYGEEVNPKTLVVAKGTQHEDWWRW